MRIKINFTPSTSNFTVDNQHIINSYIHKCLGVNNKYHDTKSDYNISHLYGGKFNMLDRTLTFSGGGYIIVSSLDNEFVSKIILGVLSNQELTNGMKFAGIDHIDEKMINGWNHFATLSPFIVKRYSDKNTYTFLTLNDDDFEKELKSYLINKISKINPKLDLNNFDVRIPRHDSHKVKKVMVKNVMNLANQCHISINCNYKVAELLYNIGIGQSTGSGFGTIYRTENKHIYK